MIIISRFTSYLSKYRTLFLDYITDLLIGNIGLPVQDFIKKIDYGCVHYMLRRNPRKEPVILSVRTLLESTYSPKLPQGRSQNISDHCGGGGLKFLQLVTYTRRNKSL